MKQNKTLIYVLFAMLVMMGQSFGQAVSPELKKLNRFVQTTSASDSAASAFRAGRDLLEDENGKQPKNIFGILSATIQRIKMLMRHFTGWPSPTKNKHIFPKRKSI